MIKNSEAERVRRSEDRLIRRAEKLLAEFYPPEEHCSQEALAQELGISRAKLRRTALIMTALQKRM